MRFDIATVDNYKIFFILEIMDKKILDYADMLVSGQLSLGYDSLPTIPYEPSQMEKFEWDFNPKNITNSFLLYAFGLLQVYILSRAFTKSADEKYINLAWDFISSFYQFSTDNKKKNIFVYNDHAVSERLENLVYFGYVAEQAGFEIKEPQILTKLIDDCVDRLDCDEYYQVNHNHGIIVDKALIIGASCLNNDRSENLIDHAISRLKKQIEFAYGPDGVHAENSFDYHVTITNLLRGIQNALIFINHPFSSEFGRILQKTIDFIVYALKPNLQRPLFGDSKGVRGQGPADLDFSHNPSLEFIKSMGSQGTKPAKLIAYFANSGYVFFREHFEEEGYKAATWLSLKAGYKTRVHKHQDDLSICLFSKGYDIFVDAGMYNFMPKDRYKDYMESIPAHSTIAIADRPYSIARANGEKFAIQAVEQTENFEYAMASSRVYAGCAIYRHLYYFRKENILVIRDEVIADRAHHFAQYFHLGPMVKIVAAAPERTVLQIGDSGYSVVMRQLGAVGTLDVLQGTQTDPMSILSTGFSEYMDTQTIRNSYSGERFEFVTALEIKPNSNATSVFFDQVELEGKIVSIGEQEIRLVTSIPVEFEGAEIACERKTLRVRNHTRADVVRQFAAYIFDHKNRKKIAEISYTPEASMECALEEAGEYVLVYYVSNGKNEKIKGILATLQQRNGQLRTTKQYEKLHVPLVEPLKVIWEDEEICRFEIGVQYDFPCQVKWWVYRDGVSLPVDSSWNSQTFTYRFPTPGDYVIMCSVSDIYFGEFYFTQSELIHI